MKVTLERFHDAVVEGTVLGRYLDVYYYQLMYQCIGVDLAHKKILEVQLSGFLLELEGKFLFFYLHSYPLQMCS